MLTSDSKRAFTDAVGSDLVAAELLASIQDPFQDSANFLFSSAGAVSMKEGQKVLIVKKATGAATTVTLPANPVQFQTATVIDAKGDGAAHNLTIQGSGTATINGASTFVLATNYGCARFIWNGTEWNVLDAAGTALTSDLTVTGLIYESAQNAITAFSGGGQGSATALTKQVNRITTVAAPADSVKLPAAAAGLQVIVINAAATNAAAIFPFTGDAINSLSANASLSVPAGTVALFTCAVAGTWSELLLESAAGISLTSAHLLVGAASGMAADVPASGDVTLANTGAFTVTGLNGSPSSTTAAELTTLHGVTAGTVAASSAVVVNANKAVDTLRGTAELVVGGTAIPGGATVTQTITKAITGLADTTAVDFFTVTVPNAAHAAMIDIEVTGVLGAGGSIGAGEGSRVAKYQCILARTAGVNAVATLSAAIGGAEAHVAGGQAITSVVLTLSAIAGAVGASNTFTIKVAVTRSGAGATNHTAFATAKTTNQNAAGVTIV